MDFMPYLAMTAGEMGCSDILPPVIGFMACHFSPYTTGLSNLPSQLPPGAMLILNDRIPICGHVPSVIADQVAQLADAFACDCVLLDFQRPDYPDTMAVCKALVESCPCPLGISCLYAKNFQTPVFLPPPNPDEDLSSYFAPWEGRELWLETAPQAQRITVTEAGSSREELPDRQIPGEALSHTSQFCRYKITKQADRILFDLYRGKEDWEHFIAAFPQITKTVGLYQQWALWEQNLSAPSP